MVSTYHVEMHAFIILDTPVVIYTDILLRSMGPISEKDMVSRLYENSEICAKCKLNYFLSAKSLIKFYTISIVILSNSSLKNFK